MQQSQRERLRQIRTFPSLVKYLRDELDWPIASDDFDELTFDYTPEELGIDLTSAAKIQDIKRLRPLSASQPWGIFFVKFEPKRLPVVALRRILGRVVVKKRASANSDERAAWSAEDLLFVSNYGEGEERRISFAHFSQDPEKQDLPTLKVLGWDNLDTALHLDHVAEELQTKLAWPKDDQDLRAWRVTWRSAFTQRHREVITTSKALAIRLAGLARDIRARISTVLGIENESGPLTKLMAAFREALIHDLDEGTFADMYAQTIAYGLLSARITSPNANTVDGFARQIPVTNPFLKDLMETFLSVGGRNGNGKNGHIDFDELGVGEVVELLDDANMEAVVRDFGDRNPEEDPIIHFYELFLKEYDAKKRMQRGVFYTPRPVVHFIVRCIDNILRTKFGLDDGLADTTSWKTMAQRTPNLKIPDGTEPSTAFVQILDPAAGTGTFLVEVIDTIHSTMTKKWKTGGHSPSAIQVRWNKYVPKYLLPRIHGFELLMAPYAIAHMKIGLKLHETGYRFGSDERARIYLTNALEPPHDFSGRFAFAVPALAHEAEAVNAVKSQQRFTVITGNPPYANYGQLNKIPRILDLLGDYKRGLGEKKINLDDDFVKFIRQAHDCIETSGMGLVGMITNNTYLDGLTHRRMREHLLDTFPSIQILNLHGSSKKKERAPDGSQDENVFDITIGVAVVLLTRPPDQLKPQVLYGDSWGSRSSKTQQLRSSSDTEPWAELEPKPENWFFVPKDLSAENEYRLGLSLEDIFVVYQNGLKTDRDDLFFDYDRRQLESRMRRFYAPHLDESFRKRYRVLASTSYDIETRRLQTQFNSENIRRCLYRPFDIRWLYYDPKLTSRPAQKVMQHMLPGANRGIITTRQTKDLWGAVATQHLCGHKSCGAYDINSLFPLYVFDGGFKFTPTKKNRESLPGSARHNFSPLFLDRLAERLALPLEGSQRLPAGLTAEQVFGYLYAVLYSPTYRRRYEELLKIGYPRLPVSADLGLLRALADLGGELVALHLLESPTLKKCVTTVVGSGEFQVEKPSFSRETVWLDKTKTRGFRGVSEPVWSFQVGGYQVCEKWLKDRSPKKGAPGRVLVDDDIAHYQKTVTALGETIRVMREIDDVIDAHGGWPGAFAKPQETSRLHRVAETGPEYGKKNPR